MNPTTSNGKPWAVNIAHIFKWVFGAYALKRGLEAEQRRHTSENESMWAPFITVGTAMAWFYVYWAMVIMFVFDIFGTVSWFLIERARDTTAGIVAAVIAVPTMIFFGICLVAAHGLKLASEGLPVTNRQSKAMGSRWARPVRRKHILATWFCLIMLPQLAVSQVAASRYFGGERGGCAVPPCMVHQDYVPFAPGDGAVLLNPPPTTAP